MKDNIKTAEEFYKDYVDFSIVPYEEYDAKTIINDSVLAMKEYAEQFIDLAAEEALITDGETSSNIMGDSTEYGDTSYFVDKESILKVKQLIK